MKSRNPKGLGSYYKKEGLFCWRYTVDGQTVYRSAKTQAMLQDKVREVIGLPVTKDKSTVAEWFERWLEVYVKPLRKKATYDQHFYMTKHILPVMGSKKLSHVRPFDVQAVISSMAKKGLATKTMKHALNTMKVAFDKAVFERLLARSPVEGIEIPKRQTEAKKVLNIEEIQSLYAAMAASRWLHSVRFGLTTGLRRGELLALRWSDIDWTGRRIQVERSNSKGSGVGDTKGAKVHHAPLSRVAADTLTRQAELLLEEHNPVTYRGDNSRLTVEQLQASDALVFPSERGDEIQPDTYYHTVKRFAAKAGIDAHPHCFRHTFVYRLRHKLSLKELQNALGHDESTTTLDIYGDMLDDTADKVADAIDAAYAEVEAEAETPPDNVIDLAARRSVRMIN